jgi:tetratricopeptide (TPR) repeat protein
MTRASGRVVPPPLRALLVGLVVIAVLYVPLTRNVANLQVNRTVAAAGSATAFLCGVDRASFGQTAAQAGSNSYNAGALSSSARGRWILPWYAARQGECEAALDRLEGRTDAPAVALRVQLCVIIRRADCARAAIDSSSAPDVAYEATLRQAEAFTKDGQNLYAVETFGVADGIRQLDALHSRTYLGLLLETGRYQAALARAQTLTRDAPDDAEAHYLMARAIAVTGGSLAERTQSLERAVALRDYAPYRFDLGAAYVEGGRTAAAREQFERLRTTGYAPAEVASALAALDKAAR